MKKFGMAWAFLVAGLWAGSIDPARADPESIGTYGAWEAVTFDNPGDQGCYIASTPTKQEGKFKKRGEQVFALVTHRPANNSLNVVSIMAGFTYKKGSKVEVAIGDEKFELFTDGETAWAEDADDGRLVAAMKKANRMVVQSTSSRDNKIKDTYSLEGFSKAYEAINQACGVNPPTG